MLNNVNGDMITKFAELSDTAKDVSDLAHHLVKFKWPMLTIGGAADLRDTKSAWGNMVEKGTLYRDFRANPKPYSFT